MVLRLYRPAFLLIFSVLVTCSRRDRGEYCTLGGQRYKMGQTWHPTLAPFGQNSCINCTCYKGGQIKCQGIDCPRPDCEEPKILEGECCPTCDDFDNLPPTVGKEGSKEEEDRKPGCHFDGKTFKDSDVFPSNSTGLRPTRQEQCVMCVCVMGKVFCQLKTCLPTKCKSFKTVPDDCCPQCADESDYTDEYLHYILSDPKQDNRTDADCTSPMGLHQNGSSWNPIIGVYGEVKCIVCTCLNGNVTCDRLECPPVSSLPCKRPRFISGSCCKQCPRRRKGGVKGQTRPAAGQEGSGSQAGDSGRKRKGRKRGRGRKKKKNRRGKSRGRGRRKCRAADREMVHPDRKSNATSVASVFEELCLPRHTDRLVYRGTGDNYEMLAFDGIGDQSVEMLQWNLTNGVLQDTERKLVQAAEFRQTATCSQIIGATNKRGFKKLLKKIDSKLRKCKSQSRRCTPKTLDKIINRDRRLKDLPTQRVCGE